MITVPAAELPGELEAATTAVIDALVAGFDVILFAPGRVRTRAILDWVECSGMEIRTPESIGFNGFPTSRLTPAQQRMMRGAVSRDHVGSFLLDANRDGGHHPFLCSVLAAGDTADEGDFDGLASRGIKAKRWPENARWRCMVIGLAMAVEEPAPRVVWTRTIIREEAGTELGQPA